MGGESMFLFSLPTSFNCPSWDINYSHAMKVSSFWSCRYFNLGLQKRMPSNCNVHYITAHLEPFIFTNSMVFFFSTHWIYYCFVIEVLIGLLHICDQHKFVFLYTRRTPGVRTQTSYEENIKKIMEFSTVSSITIELL